MFNAQKPDPSELPSTGRLLKSTGIAAAVAGAMLVFVVLPAEYGVDPTGAGSLLGLTEMGHIKMQLAAEAALDQAEIIAPSAAASTPPPKPAPREQASSTSPAPSAAATATPSTPSASAPQSATAVASDESVFTLAPDEGFEIKLVMVKGPKPNSSGSPTGPASTTTPTLTARASAIMATAKARTRPARRANWSPPSTAATAGSGATAQIRT